MRRTKKMATDEAKVVISGIETMNHSYRKDMESKLVNALIEAVRSLAVLNPKDVKVKPKAKGSYHSYNSLYRTQEIVLGMVGIESEEKSNANLKTRIVYHEIGHYIDRKSGSITHSDKYAKKFKSALWKETKAIVAEYDSRFAMNSLGYDMLDKIIVSDMISAVYKNKIPVPYGHTGAYWKKDKYNINSEAFAHFFSASFVPPLMNQIKTYYPQSYAIFMKMLKQIGG